jgi:capsular polysaccharide biosynthesis protein
MEIDEVGARLLRQYWPVLLAAILLPAMLTGLYVVRQPQSYTATARIVASDKVPQVSGEAAGVVAHARAYATSRDVVAAAIKDIGSGRVADDVVKHVNVVGIGTSPVVALTVTDSNPKIARGLTNALAIEVTKQLTASKGSGLQDTIAQIDKRITTLQAQRAKAESSAANDPKNLLKQLEVQGLDRQISDLTSERNRLATLAATTGQPRVVERPALPTHADPSGLPARVSLAALFGLVVGIILTACVETLRPTVPGPQRVARRLDVPLLGPAGGRDDDLPAVARALRLAARRAEVNTIALTGRVNTALPAQLTQAVGGGATARRSTDWKAPGDHAPDHSLADTSLRILAAEMRAEPRHADFRICALADVNDDDPGSVGLVVVAGPVTRLADLHGIRDLLAASGWPLLGVVADTTSKKGKRG